MDVEIVQFPEIKVAAIEHRGPPTVVYETVDKLTRWRKQNGLQPSPEHLTYGLHYHDPRRVEPEEYRVDICVSVREAVSPNPYGVVNKVIPACRCARVRYIGPREHVVAAEYLYDKWLPGSGEQFAGLPVIFHYVNVGPRVREHEMITDVYLPLV